MTPKHEAQATTRADGSPTLAARNYSWSPFDLGNTAALAHGSYSERAINARAVEVHAALLQHAPYLDEPRFIPAVNRYLQAAAREALLHDYITKVCDERGPGAVPSRTWEQATAATRLSAKLGSDLGLDVIGHARIRALTVGAEATTRGIEALGERGYAIRQQHDPSLQLVTDDDEADEQ